LGPRVGEQHKGARQRLRRQRLHHKPGVVGEQPDIRHARPLDVRQALGDTVHIGLAADQPDRRMILGLPDEVLAGTEPHFQPHALRRQRAAESLREIDLRGAFGDLVVGRDDGFGGQGDGEARQQRVEQRLLPGPQFLAPSTAMQRASAGFFHDAFRVIPT
jgi:hypothetical protein